MSAYIVSDETINKVVSYLYCKKDSHFWPANEIKESYNLKTRQDFERLAQDMFNLNIEAVEQRYGKGQAKEFRPLNFQFRLTANGTSIHVLKALRCWLYQCSEGDCPEVSFLYKMMNEFSHLLALDIVENMPAYENAPWS